MVALHFDPMNAATLADRIRLARANANITQEQLARRAGVTRSLISQWETGLVQSISAGHLHAAAKALHVSLDWLLEGSESEAVNGHAARYDVPDSSELGVLWSELTASQRKEVLENIRKLAQHNRDLLSELGSN